ncbi:MAG: GNAT family N-acetyltransferase [Cyanobacteria bacterium SZAS-4]|nr:GNAT family N-acetyltransferase [Cyanobacteria bacterium SZAS-4]
MAETENLPEEVLAKRLVLPVKMDPVSLVGTKLRLVPLDVARDAAALFAVSNGSAISMDGVEIAAYDPETVVWQYMNSSPYKNLDAFKGYLAPLAHSENGLAMCVFDEKSQTQVGVATFMNNHPEHLKIELGNIWYSPVVQRRGFNPEATYLMLKHAFELGYRRVEWKCNALNLRSRNAALRMGFIFEGIQESHFIVKDKNRDTAWFRMLDHEWPCQKTLLEKIIA